ncbi:ELMD2 protein, partial [Amia calva]|nr:ELMD2 protein [Amia calva]
MVTFHTFPPFQMFTYIWQYLYTSFLRFWLKWFIRQITGKCELQRICDGYDQGATRTLKTEYSLEASKSQVRKAPSDPLHSLLSQVLRSAVTVEEDEVEKCVKDIMKEKNVSAQKDPKFKMNLHVCLLQISGYKKLYVAVEDLRKQTFNSEMKEHENMLLKLWNLLMPTVRLESRVTKQWGDIGFQGDDPKTDFRGMGMLGLSNLVFFSENHTEVARQVLSHSNHPKLGLKTEFRLILPSTFFCLFSVILYSYAIVGINLTEMAYSLLKSGALKTHFYNVVSGNPQMEHFHQVYCYLVYEFDKFWFKEEPQSIMEFNHYREKFHEKVKRLLLEPDVALSITLDAKQ